MKNMKGNQLFYLSFLITVIVTATNGQVTKAKKFLERYNRENILERQKKLQLKYKQFTNYTAYNTEQAQKAELKYEQNMKDYRKEAAAIDLADSDESTKRQFKMLLNTITSKDPYVNDNLLRYKNLMQNIFQKASVEYNPNKIKTLKKKKVLTPPMLGYIMETSSDPDELQYVWEAFRDVIGPNVNDYYTEYVRLNNIGARENGYKDAGDYKRKLYDVDNLDEIAEDVWEELKPFYEELHAYVRFRLKEHYPSLIQDGEPLPAHLLGNIWAHSWETILSKCKPYPDEPSIDVSDTIRATMNVTDMFKTAEDFFVSIGWGRLPNHFWNVSVFEKPKDRDVTCHASAWDLYGMVNNEKDLRLVMCATPSHYDLLTIHHELGHLYYAIKYWELPIEFRAGANPAFHEAVGDTLSMSITPPHLHKIGLLSNISYSKETDINFLFKSALETISFLPYAYIMDKWMWNVYNGSIKPQQYNKAWWEMRVDYQGIKAPSTRQDDHLDLATKYHITADVPYIRYFFSVILQFVFHKHSCKFAKVKGDLHKCSIYESKAAGKAFGDMLSLGKSKPWPEQLKQFTGSEKISAEPIMEYFAPLRKWLKEQQQKHKYIVGWKKPKKFPVSRGTMNKSTITLATIFTITVILLQHFQFI